MDSSTTESTVHSTQPIPTIKTILTAQELSRIVPLHPVTILRWARQGRIPHRRLSSRKIVFLLPEINEWLASGYTEPVVRAA